MVRSEEYRWMETEQFQHQILSTSISEGTTQEALLSDSLLNLIRSGRHVLNRTKHTTLYDIYLHTYQHLIPVNISETLVLILVSFYVYAFISSFYTVALLSVVYMWL